MALAQVQEKYLPRNNAFYRDNYRYFLFGLMAVIVILLAMVWVLLFEVLHRPLPAFAAVQPNGQSMQLYPFEEPNLLPDTLLRWAGKAASTAYTFDFVNYEQEISQARPYFTEAGWEDFRSAINNVLKTVVQNQLFVTGVVSGPPVISNQGPLVGKGYVWRIQIPFLVTYQSSNTTTTGNFIVIVSIVRVPTSTNPQGIGIDQFIMASGHG